MTALRFLVLVALTTPAVAAPKIETVIDAGGIALSSDAEADWQPSRRYMQLRWRANESEAADLVQSFFENVVRRGLLATYQPARARFRTFLRTCLDHHAVDDHRRRSAQRRGGGAAESSCRMPSTRSATRRSIWISCSRPSGCATSCSSRSRGSTSDSPRRASRPTHAALFKAFHVGDAAPSYSDAAATYGRSVTDVTNWLHGARKEFRKIALELLRELTIDDDDFAAEAMAVFGIDVTKRA